MQCRVTTEDPQNDFRPSYGTLTAYRPATGFGIRLDGGTAYTGATITPFYDSLLEKVTAWSPSFEETRLRMLRALARVSHPRRRYQRTVPRCPPRRARVHRRDAHDALSGRTRNAHRRSALPRSRDAALGLRRRHDRQWQSGRARASGPAQRRRSVSTGATSRGTRARHARPAAGSGPGTLRDVDARKARRSP